MFIRLQEEAKSYNDKCINEIESASREKMFQKANGISDSDLNSMFFATKLAALKEV